MKIVLGVTGGIAAYKTPELVRRLQDAGADVRVVLTPNATRFVAPDGARRGFGPRRDHRSVGRS